MKNFLEKLFTRRNLGIAGLAALAFFVFLAALNFGLGEFNRRKFEKELKKLTEEAERPYLEDVYGGKTPKETLELFVAAVEKEDFDLASRYFVIEKQEEWRNKLMNIKNVDKLEYFLKPIIEEINKLETGNSSWENKETYITGDSVLFEFLKYPRGIWKIKEI